MSGARRRDTAPEIAVRRALHGRGLRYRVTYPVPGWARRSIDIAFIRARVAVFVDGCFWHGCPQHQNRPRANSEWWEQKIGANMRRDADTTRYLTDLGWAVLRFWEHEPPDSVAEVVAAVLGAERPVP